MGAGMRKMASITRYPSVGFTYGLCPRSPKYVPILLTFCVNHMLTQHWHTVRRIASSVSRRVSICDRIEGRIVPGPHVATRGACPQESSKQLRRLSI